MNRDDRKLPPRREIALRCKDVAGATKVTNEVGQHEELVTGRKTFALRKGGQDHAPTYFTLL